MHSSVLGATDKRTIVATLVDLVRLCKPRITVMVMITAAAGMWLAARSEPALSGRAWWQTALAALGGIALTVSGANALNMFLERDSDALMERTAGRPLPAGRLSPGLALGFGLALGIGALPLLALLVNPTTAMLAAIALAIYVLAYTPLKRVTSRALEVGAIPGAMPPLLGWTAVTGRIDWPAVALFAVLFFWQLPHFVAIATFRGAEYQRAGIKVLTAERGHRAARQFAVGYLGALVAASLCLVPLYSWGSGTGERIYLAAALVLGGGFFAVGLRGLRPGAGEGWARLLFVASLVYLPALIAAMVVGA